MKLVESLRRHVLVGAGQRSSQVPEQWIGQDAFCLLGGVGLLPDDGLERLGLVEHGGPQFTPAVVNRHLLRFVVQPDVEPEGVGQAVGGIDGEHDHPLPALGQCEPERGRHRCLSHPAGSEAENHPVVGERSRFPAEVRLGHPWSPSPRTTGLSTSASARIARSSGPREAVNSWGRWIRGKGSSAPSRASWACWSAVRASR